MNCLIQPFCTLRFSKYLLFNTIDKPTRSHISKSSSLLLLRSLIHSFSRWICIIVKLIKEIILKLIDINFFFIKYHLRVIIQTFWSLNKIEIINQVFRGRFKRKWSRSETFSLIGFWITFNFRPKFWFFLFV